MYGHCLPHVWVWFSIELSELFNWQTLLLKTRVRITTINSTYTEQFKMRHTHFLSPIYRMKNLQSRGSAYLPREVQKCWWASRVFWQRLLRVSQTRRLLSSLALTINLPPGWNTTPRTQLSWPTNVKRHMPVPTSQTCRTIKINVMTKVSLVKTYQIYVNAPHTKSDTMTLAKQTLHMKNLWNSG